MAQTSIKGPSRPRLTLDVSLETLEAIDQEVEKQSFLSTRQQFCQEAIGEALRPTFTFHAFNLPERQPPQLKDLLKRARKEIIMLGLALTSLQEGSSQGEALRECLYEKIGEGVRMTFLTLHPQIDETDSVYLLANKRYAGNDPSFDSQGLKGELRKTYKVLRDLYREGAKKKVSVDVLGVKELLPTCGMIIIDPSNISSCIMQVAPYLYGTFPQELDPSFEIDARRTEEGRDAITTFMAHYRGIERVAEPIKEFPEEGGG